jgi:hypothetical protein
MASRLRSFLLFTIGLALYLCLFIHDTSPKTNETYKNSTSIDQTISPPYQTVNVRFSYYDPTKGGINCDQECRHTASGEEILDIYYNPMGPWWWDGDSSGVACPPEYPFGTVFYVKLPDETNAEFTCIDRGESIVIENENGTKITRLDILHFDNKGCGKKYCWPETTRGYKINSSTIYEADVRLPDMTNAEIPSVQKKGESQNALGPTGRYCHSNYLEKLGKDPRIPEGMCPPLGWKAWCPYGQGREDGMGQLVSIESTVPQPRVNCYQER